MEVPHWLRRARRQAIDLAWRGQWRAVRAAATPWVKRELAAARAKLPRAAVVDHGRAAPPRAAVIDRESLDGWLRDAAPPEVPFEVAVLPGRDLASRFPDGPSERRSGHLIGKLRMTHRAIPSE